MKTKHALIAGLIVAGLITAAGYCRAAEGQGHHAKEVEKPKITAQTTCPVMGGKINKDLYVDHEGKRVYLCCRGCIDVVKKDPQKYIKKLEAAGVSVAKLQTTCPVMGGKIDKKQYVDAKGKRIYVCCAGCIGKITADPAKYIKQLEASGVVLDAASKRESGHGGHDDNR